MDPTKLSKFLKLRNEITEIGVFHRFFDFLSAFAFYAPA